MKQPTCGKKGDTSIKWKIFLYDGKALFENGKLNNTFWWVTFCFRMCCPNTLINFG
jgi:hypothetical protein